jgi:hypothetical protein
MNIIGIWPCSVSLPSLLMVTSVSRLVLAAACRVD